MSPQRTSVGGPGEKQRVADMNTSSPEEFSPVTGGMGGVPPENICGRAGWETYLSNIQVIFEATTGKTMSEIKQPNPAGK